LIRGEIWWADFGIPFGSEPGYRRPVLIIQDDAFNESRIDTVVVLPLSTNLSLENAPGNVSLAKADSGLPKDSVIVVSQLYTIDKARLLEQVSKVRKSVVNKVEQGIKLVLGLSDAG
jgi:mRNA interferase MazF